MENIFKEKDENSRIRRFISLDKNTLPVDGGPDFNRLIFSTSPYLLQHADNPVDWHPWGDEAFAKAAREDKPVMVSIGYATCHWCHVMAHESFEDPDVAEVINRCVVPVKVDREERPDIDLLYMTAARVLTGGSAGWPLTIFMTADRKPFYAATYIPKKGQNGVLGVGETLEKIMEVWRTRRELIVENCDAVFKALGEMETVSSADTNFGEVLDSALATLMGMYDYMYGGFGEKPKFPLPHYLSFLLRMWSRTGDTNVEDCVGFTLRMMRDGGIYEQLGFGFHRYTVDQAWMIPHFEKMLYDQALVAITYLEAFQAYGDTYLKDTALEIFSFVLREMTSPEGGFYSGLDADTEGSEGKYYLWTRDEVEKHLDEEPARLFCQVFGVTDSGNFEGENILHIPRSPAMVARENGLNPEELDANLNDARSRLLHVRKNRIMPFRDEKILVSWNGLMIAALARGAAVSGDRNLFDAAKSAALFVEEHLRRDDGRLLRSYHLDKASVPAFLEDHAFLCWGMLEMYQASGDQVFLEKALVLAREMLELFHDQAHGGFFDTGADVEEVLVRMKSIYDGAIPSGNSIACMCLLRLGKITFDDRLLQAGEQSLNSCMGNVRQQPVAHLQMVNALDFHLGPDVDITLVGDREDPAMSDMLRVINGRFVPGLVLRFRNDGDHNGYRSIDGRPTAFVCTKGACRPPISDVAEFERLLDEVL
ncbi:MAG: thioredoxin domain-containing protein [Desulfuromonadales bacterium]|nr:thioredoxin domain-containing protein [Desulfuromonadales bacterium]